MPTLFVTTCGTSLLTNRDKDFGGEPPAVLNQYTNHRSEGDIADADHREKLRAHLTARRNALLNADVKTTKKVSAELNGVLRFAQEVYAKADSLPSSDFHVLLHTDTWLGAEVADILEAKLRELGATVSKERIEELNTARLDDFRRGLGNLIGWVAENIPGYRQKKFRIVFNLVGGFKSVQGFMQTLGMFYADEVLYIFENGDALLRIPRIPVDIDGAAVENVRQHLPFLRRLAVRGDSSQPVPSDLPETFLYRLESDYELSPWGKIVWEQAKKKLYREELLASYSERVRYTEAFCKDARGFPPERFLQLNDRIDDLIRQVETEDANLKRLDLKKLKGNPMPPSTHEADAWADGDCRRLFLHYEDNVAVIDRLASALH